MTNKTILIISPEAWGTNFVSKHHYSNYLSKQNTVYFLNPVHSSRINPFGKTHLEIKQIKNNLVQINYHNLLPRLNRFPKFIQNYIFKKQAKQIQKALNISKFDIVWSFDPFRFWNQKNWQADKTIYFTVDLHHNTNFEENIIKTSTLTISISDHIPSKKITTKYNILTINHGFDNSNTTNLKDVTIPGNNKIKAVYVGNISSFLENDRMNFLAKTNSNVDFILIGPTSSSNLSTGQAQETIHFNNTNIYCIGEIKANLIDSYLIKCNVNLLMAKSKKGIKNVNSHKLMHYFNSGNITVSDWLLDYEQNNILNMVKTPKEFREELSIIINNLEFYNSIEKKENRKQFAIANSYDKKIEEISKLLYSN